MTWTEFFNAHPDFAAEPAKYWEPRDGDGNLARIYFGDEYLQRVISTAARRAESSYDAHRIAKGDDRVVTADVVTWHGDAARLARLLEISESKGWDGGELLPDGNPLDSLWQNSLALANRQPRSRRRSA